MNLTPELIALCKSAQAAEERYAAIIGQPRPEGAPQRIVWDMQREDALDAFVDARKAYETELRLHRAAKQFMRLPADEVTP